MQLHTDNNRFKLYLGLAGLLIMILSVVYTNHLSGKLSETEHNYTRFYVMAQEELNNNVDDPEFYDYCDPRLPTEIVLANTTIPVIITNAQGGIDYAINYGERESDTVYLQDQIEIMLNDGIEPIPSYGETNIYFRESTILQQLRYFPIVQMLLIGAFIIFGYIGINAARRAEQNRVWVGMAKETAHQLGTPISAIMAWVEHLKSIREGDEEILEIATELNNDVERLALVADRFSKIGAAPKLEVVDANEELEKCRVYMEKRAPRRVSFHFPAEAHGPSIAINPPLFDWVIENLLRNALDAMGGRGRIEAEIYEDADYVYMDISDTGKGIPAGKLRKVFQPGYTTKKRGWGLGLSLAKRIIEEYHNGKIFVKKSIEGEGTTFTISLPKVAVQQVQEQRTEQVVTA